MVRNGRRDRGPDRRAIERPALHRLAHRGERRVAGREPQPLDLLLQRRRQRIEQARNGLVETELGDHRRQHGAHAGIRVGAPAGVEPFDARQRKLDGEVVAGGAALQQHLDRADVGAEILVLERAAAGDPGPGGEQQLERPAVAHALGQIAVAVHVGVDQSGMDQPVARIDRDRVGRRREAGRSDLRDGVAGDQDVGRLGAIVTGIDQPPAANNRCALSAMATSQTACLSASTAQGKNTCSTITTA